MPLDASPRIEVESVPQRTFAEFYDSIRDKPVFVVLGVQGSGTNLLGRILVRTFGFSVLRDRSKVFDIAARLGARPDPSGVRRAIEQLRSLVAPSFLDRKLGKKVIHRSAPFSGIVEALRSANIRSGSEFARLVYAYRAYSLGLREMAIKSDDLWEHIDHMETVLPNRRIVLLTRDFRDNLVSVGGKHFGPIEPICAAHYVKRQFGIYEREFRRAGVRGFHVKFETLVEAPRRFVDEFASHFGLEPMVDPDTALETIRFRPNKIARWRKLDPRELAWCEAILSNELREWGYESVNPAPAMPPVTAVAAATVRDTIRRIPQKLRRIKGQLAR